MEAGEGDRLREMRLAALADAPQAFEATLENDAARPARDWEQLAGGPGAVFVAGDWAGMAAVGPDGEDATLWGMWVAPGARGRGAGRRLVEAAAEWARPRGLGRLRLSVSDGAPAARALYARLGFRPTGDTRRLPSDPSCTETAMTLELGFEPRRLETRRLLLRPFEAEDLEALHAILSREDVVRYLYPPPATEQDVRDRLAGRIPRTRFARTGDGIGFAAVRRDSGELIGDCSLSLKSAEHLQGEIGFVFHPGHHGHGYATEAAEALVRLGFGTFGLHRLIGSLEARNGASARVLERLGMRRESHLVENELVKGEWQSELVYALLASEWRG